MKMAETLHQGAQCAEPLQHGGSTESKAMTTEGTA